MTDFIALLEGGTGTLMLEHLACSLRWHVAFQGIPVLHELRGGGMTATIHI